MEKELIMERMEYLRGRYHAQERRLMQIALELQKIVRDMNICRKEWEELNESTREGRKI